MKVDHERMASAVAIRYRSHRGVRHPISLIRYGIV